MSLGAARAPAIVLGCALVLGGCVVDWSRPPDVAACAERENGAGQPFGSPTVITALLNDNTDLSPSVTADGLELYFRSNRAAPEGVMGDGAIFVSSRDEPSEGWGPPRLVAEIDGPGRNRGPHISRDGLTIYWAAERRTGTLEIWWARRDRREEPFERAEPVPGLEGWAATMPTVDARQTSMVVQSRDTEPRVGGDDLYLLVRDPDSGEWSAPQLISSVASEAHEETPFLSDDGLVLYFARSDESMPDASAIYRARRPSRDEPFGDPTAVEGLAGPLEDHHVSLSADCGTAYFASDRGGDDAIWEAHRP